MKALQFGFWAELFAYPTERGVESKEWQFALRSDWRSDGGAGARECAIPPDDVETKWRFLASMVT